MDMAMVMDTMVMERGKPRPLLLLKLMLNQDIIIMATLTDMVMDMAIMDMERGKLMLPPDTITMVMAMDMDMERGKLMLPPVTITMVMVMDMVDMVMDMVMVMDTMVKQYLFISFSKICCI